MQVTKHASEGIHPSFETQGRHHCKSITGVSLATRKGLMSSKFFFKKYLISFGNYGLVSYLIRIADIENYIHAHWSKHI